MIVSKYCKNCHIHRLLKSKDLLKTAVFLTQIVDTLFLYQELEKIKQSTLFHATASTSRQHMEHHHTKNNLKPLAKG